MRRLTTIMLLLAMLAFYLVPLSAAVSDGGVPFCCRAKGKHHCEMSGDAPRDLGVQSPNRCPYRNPAPLVGQQITAASVRESASFFAPETKLGTQVQSLFFKGASLRLTPGKRGPPILL